MDEKKSASGAAVNAISTCYEKLKQKGPRPVFRTRFWASHLGASPYFAGNYGTDGPEPMLPLLGELCYTLRWMLCKALAHARPSTFVSHIREFRVRAQGRWKIGGERFLRFFYATRFALVLLLLGFWRSYFQACFVWSWNARIRGLSHSGGVYLGVFPYI